MRKGVLRLIRPLIRPVQNPRLWLQLLNPDPCCTKVRHLDRSRAHLRGAAERPLYWYLSLLVLSQLGTIRRAQSPASTAPAASPQ